jgi:hypothetical protein
VDETSGSSFSNPDSRSDDFFQLSNESIIFEVFVESRDLNNPVKIH